MKKRRSAVLAASVAVAGTCVAIPSRADPAPPAATVGPEAVYLRDGQVLRGTVTEVVDKDHVTLTLANGQSAQIAWSSIARVERNAPNSAAPNSPPGPEKARVHIDGERDVRLEILAAGGKSWLLACESPCDIDLPIIASYGITGDGMVDTEPFALKAGPGEAVRIKYRPAPRPCTSAVSASRLSEGWST